MFGKNNKYLQVESEVAVGTDGHKSIRFFLSCTKCGKRFNAETFEEVKYHFCFYNTAQVLENE